MRERLAKCFFGLLLVNLATGSQVCADGSPDPRLGLRLLLEKPYLPAAFDNETWQEVWKVWEEPSRAQAADATPAERQRLAFRRYGLTARPDDPQGRPMQYVIDSSGSWTMNCLACHQGMVAGRMIPGLPNSHFALETLTQDIRATKIRLGKRLTDLDMGYFIMPLGTTVGTTNAVMFGVALFHYRDADLNLIERSSPPRLIHHDHDAPPWWNTSRKQRLYADDFAPRGHRALMQFLASKENGPEKFSEWEDDFRHVEAYIDSLRPPVYPFEIDRSLAAEGRLLFEANCSDCHGTYGGEASYPEVIVPLEEIGTDALRLKSLTVIHRRQYSASWINDYGRSGEVIDDPGGYVAPPLDGIWASAPYLHNGSLPTLWHVLHPEYRPTVWYRPDRDAYDQQRVGILVEELPEVPPKLSLAERRHYFDTRVLGKSAAGHDFPQVLSEHERQAVLEYLKSL